MKKLVFGVGIYDVENISNISIREMKSKSKYYTVWKSMLRRCYYEDYHKTRPTYKDCTVCIEWLRYSIFVSWMEIQDWKNKQLDKDIRVPGNKQYSSETCVFVSSYINSLVLDNAKGLYPKGVCKCTRSNKYTATINHDGIHKHLGAFNTIREARNAYIVAKTKAIEKEANSIKGDQSEKIKIGLMKHRALLLNELKKEDHNHGASFM